MRRGQRSQQSLDQSDLRRGRQRRQQTQRGTHRHGRTEIAPEVTSLRRSARLRSALLEPGFGNLASEAEAVRTRLRFSSRRLRISEGRSETSEESHSERQDPGAERRDHLSNTYSLELNTMHHTPTTNGSPNGGDRLYTLDLPYPLPRQVQVNSPMNPPPAVRLHVRNLLTNSEISRQDELGYLFVTITLCREDGEGLLPQNHEMQGTTASLEPLNEGTQFSDSTIANGTHENIPLSQQIGSFAHFSNFTIIRPGNYKLKFMLVKVEQPGSVSPGGRGVDRGGSRVLTTFISPDVIVAQEGPVSPSYGWYAQVLQ